MLFEVIKKVDNKVTVEITLDGEEMEMYNEIVSLVGQVDGIGLLEDYMFEKLSDYGWSWSNGVFWTNNLEYLKDTLSDLRVYVDEKYKRSLKYES